MATSKAKTITVLNAEAKALDANHKTRDPDTGKKWTRPALLKRIKQLQGAKPARDKKRGVPPWFADRYAVLGSRTKLQKMKRDEIKALIDGSGLAARPFAHVKRSMLAAAQESVESAFQYYNDEVAAKGWNRRN